MLEHRPVGFGSHHWLTTDNVGVRRFVTVDELSSQSRTGDEISVLGLHLRPALEAAIDLQAFGCRFVVAPITTRTDNPFVQYDGHALRSTRSSKDRASSLLRSRSENATGIRFLGLLSHCTTCRLVRSERPHSMNSLFRGSTSLDVHASRRGGWTHGPYADAASQLLIHNEDEISSLIALYQS
jgi:hypothetical protein